MHLLGCFFVFIFGFVLLIFVAFRLFLQSIFGKFFGRSVKNEPFGQKSRSYNKQQGSYGRTYGPYGPNSNQQSAQTENAHSYSHTTAGNARHEGDPASSRQARTGKIFQKDEGEYVDFEEV